MHPVIPAKHIQRYDYIAENPVEGRRLGRHILHDQRSHDHPAATAHALTSVTHTSVGLPLDQDKPKPWGSCTANALCGGLNSTPDSRRANFTPKVEADAFSLYQLEGKLEGYSIPPQDPGGSGLMVSRAAKQLGWIRSYKHAFGLEHALHALVLRPVIFGVNWYDSFDNPDPHTGVVDLPAGASIRGGHEICALRIIAEHELIGFAQSWGQGWGVPDPEMGLPNGGAFYMPFNILDRLLQEQGDATVPTT